MKIIYAVILAAAFIIPGCYTILEHPNVSSKDENGFVYHEDVKFNDDCNSCHNAADQEMVNNEPSMYRTYHTEKSYYGDSYYPDDFYGGYGYYYNSPWWYQVSQNGSGKDQTAKDKSRSAARNNTGSARNENNEREVTRSTTENSGLNYTSPTRSSNRGSSSSGTTTETTKPSGSSDSSSGSRSTSDQPKSRDNSGNRSSGSGRR